MRWVYRQNENGEVEKIQVGADFSGAERRAQTMTEELAYGGVQATDGTDISSRKKHREYLKRNGLTHMSDYAPDYGERVRKSQDIKETKSIRESVERTLYEMDRKKR